MEINDAKVRRGKVSIHKSWKRESREGKESSDHKEEEEAEI